MHHHIFANIFPLPRGGGYLIPGWVLKAHLSPGSTVMLVLDKPLGGL